MLMKILFSNNCICLVYSSDDGGDDDGDDDDDGIGDGDGDDDYDVSVSSPAPWSGQALNCLLRTIIRSSQVR